MIGTTISHYKITEKLGGGGMGVVYKAEDTKLKRTVALKFLPPNFALDDEVKQRFVHEAQSASALDHSNICTIYEIDETPDLPAVAGGQLFIAMAYYGGETLKKRIDNGPILYNEVIEIIIQIVKGLKEAHEKGIVHRDIKPANIFITNDGVVKILDFGLAKAKDQTELTKMGSTSGTVSYMSPEQTAGGKVDHRTDIWSLGVVMYEMLTGEKPFQGDYEQAVIYSIINEEPKSIEEIMPDTPEEIVRIVNLSMVKKQDLRYSAISEILIDLIELQKSFNLAGIAEKETKNIAKRLIKRPVIAIPGIAIILLFFLFLFWFLNRNASIRWATEEALPQIIHYVEVGDIVSAFYLAKDAENFIPENPMLKELWPRISENHSIITTPDGADIYFKEYSAINSEYEYLGKTPIENIRFPIGVFRWEIKKEGYQSLETVMAVGEAAGGYEVHEMNLNLSEIGSLPTNMIKIHAQTLSLRIMGFSNAKSLFAPSYLIDQCEVTNEQFKMFIDAGAYKNPKYWKQEFKKDASSISWESAMDEFHDKSGRLGPSTWEGGTYPKGEANYPVSGVSWYEAMAYAEFADKDLPTIYHWVNAARVVENNVIVPYSNFGGGGTAPVGSYKGIGLYGLYDMAGNVKEWLWNSNDDSGNLRYILGGGWAEPSYQFLAPEVRSSWNRLPDNGFRTVKYIEEEESLNDTLFHALKYSYPKFDKTPVSDKEYQFYEDYLYSYDQTPLNVIIDSVDDSSPLWRRERILYDAAYGNERIIAHLFIPKGIKPPYQTIIYFPGSRAASEDSSEKLAREKGHLSFFWEYLIMGGRALMYPVYIGTYERRSRRESLSYSEYRIRINKDMRRSIDYLCTRNDIDVEKLAYYGNSWGANLGLMNIALEKRIRLGILIQGGLSWWEMPPEIDPVNFAPRVKVPILIINGDLDSSYPEEISQKPMYRLLGTPEGDKVRKTYPGGHGMYGIFLQDIKTEITGWLDHYFGPVE
ncbi:MAG: protein kinase [Bacteroidota bacterium]